VSCEANNHDFVPAGICYGLSDYPMPGSGAHTVRYYEKLVCRRCGDEKLFELNCTHDSYQQVRFGAVPRRI